MIDGNIKENDFTRLRQVIKKLADAVNALSAASGSASVIDADTLDGLHASAFVKAATGGAIQSISATSPITITSGSRPVVGFDDTLYMLKADLVFLSKDTAMDVIIGPLVQSVDGKTPVIAFDLDDATCSIYKGATKVDITLTVDNFEHIADGFWQLSLTDSHTDTPGYLLITLRGDDVFLPYAERLVVR